MGGEDQGAAERRLEEIAFDPADAKAALKQLPQRPAVFALYGADAHAEPYIGRTPNLRRGWNGCCSHRQNIREGCSLPGAFGALRGI